MKKNRTTINFVKFLALTFMMMLTATVSAQTPLPEAPADHLDITESACATFTWRTVTYTTSGTYTDEATGDVLHLTINALPTAEITAGGATTFCAGGSVTLTATEGASYLWSTGAITQSIDVSTTSSPTVTVTNAAGCSVTSAATSVTVNALPTAEISAGSTTSFCSGGSVTLTASAGSSWLWSTGATTQSIDVSTTSSPTVTVTNAAGCSATSAATSVTVTGVTTHTTTLTVNAASYTWTAGNGNTYTSSTTVDYVTGCHTETLVLTLITTQIPASPYAVCTGTTVATATAGTTLKFYKDTKTTTAAYAGTTKLAALTYYVTETPVGGSEGPRTAVTVTLTALVAPTTIASTEAKLICKYIGTDNLVTFTTAPVTGASSYTWTAPLGAVITNDGVTALISFKNVSATAGAIGSVTVDSNNALGCPSGKPKALALTTKAASAPKTVALTYNGAAVKKAGNFVGDASKVLTLTATDISGTADHHEWTLPLNTTVVTGDPENDLVLTIHLGNVAASNTALAFTATSVAGCGSGSKTLSVARAEAGTPKGIVLTDATLATAPGVEPAVLPIVLKKLDSYTGSLKTRTLTLTATPNTAAGSEATSYKWVLPAAATVVGGTATVVVGQENTYTSTSNVISVNLANVQAELGFTFKVFGVNGNGTSLASKDLACTSALPKAPAAIYAGTNTSATGTKFTTYSPSCGIVTISVPEVFGVENNFEVTAGTAGLPTIVSHEPGSNVATIDLSALGGSVVAKSTITIRAIAYTATGPIYKDYIIKIGTACSTPTRIAPEAVAATEKFNAVAYPNPATEGFKVKSSNGKSFGVQVYDMLGRSIEQRQMSSDAQIGSNYAKGIYNVIVNQGASVKTLRVIKQ